MVRILGTCAALALIIVLAFPFGKEAYHRYEVAKRLDPLMNERDRAEMRQWNGGAEAYGRTFLDRCEVQNGRDSTLCESIKSALR